jgi:hypothetical protein
MTNRSPEPPHEPAEVLRPQSDTAPAAGVTAAGAAEPVGARPRTGLPPTDEEQIESGFDNMPV